MGATKTKPALFDVIEVVVEIPEHHLHPGARGAIVQCHADETYEVEFTNEEGETETLCALSAEQFIIVWQANTRTWLPTGEQIASIVAQLPEDARQEVLEFAQFVHARRQRQRATAESDLRPKVTEPSA